MLLSIVLAASPAFTAPPTGPGVIPQPALLEYSEGEFVLSPHTHLAANTGAWETATYLAQALQQADGHHRTVKPLSQVQGEQNLIRLVLEEAGSTAKPESYTLELLPDGMLLRAPTAAGLFHGVQSFLQLLVPSQDDAAAGSQVLRAPCVRIEDEPRFAWRGFMLDEARHFFGKDVVMQLLDAMARLKLNRFHWHLTDESGWRIEIKAYPRLTEIGAVGTWSQADAPARFYTQAEIREIVDYARQRHIVVIPEIDMPGHATAATRAYPELSGGGSGQWQGFTFNPAKAETYQFLETVLTEVAGLFPGPYLHIGADEVSYGNQDWKTDPQIQSFIRDHDLKDALGLEHYFVRRIQAVVQGLGKTMVGWDEMVDAGVPPGQSVVMWWRHDKPQLLDRALANGYAVILCPRRPCYLDFVQHDSHQSGRRWDGFNDLESVYAFPESLGDRLPANSPQVLGIQANLWTERVADAHRLGFMTFPRLIAAAEAAWTAPSGKSHASFLDRLPPFLQWLEQRGVSYFDVFHPERTPEPVGPAKRNGGTADG